MPAVTITTRPSFGPVVAGPADPERSAERVMLAVGKDRHRGGRRPAGSSRVTSPPCSCCQQRLQDRLDLRGRLPLAEDDLGKSAPHPAVQVDLGEPARVLERLDQDLLRPLRPARTRPSRTASSNCLSSCESIDAVSGPRLPQAFVEFTCESSRVVGRLLDSATRDFVSLVTAEVAIRNRFELSSPRRRMVNSMSE